MTWLIYCNDPKFLDRQVLTHRSDREEQSDQGLRCLPFCLRLLDPLLCSKMILFKFKDIYSSFYGCPYDHYSTL